MGLVVVIRLIPFFIVIMGRNINTGTLTKQYILSKVSQITIFSTYLNLSDRIIQYCIDSGELICSPIRYDKHPTCGFKYDNKGKLKFRDFSGFFWGDCFDVVAFVMSSMYNKSYNVSNKQDFIKILRHITFTFKDIFYGQEKDINMINDINASIDNIKNKKPIIEVVIRQWTNKDIDYWKQFSVDIDWLNVNLVYAVDQYYINRNINPQPKYYYRDNDPCYAYYLGQDRNGINSIKLYFPKRNKTTTRFITNCNHLEGILNLDRNDYDIIVITKSTKDRLSLTSALYRLSSLYGVGGIGNIGVINIPHESYRLKQNEYDWLDSKLVTNGIIVSLMDNDTTGKCEAIWLKRNYNIIPILIPEEYKAKDFSELIAGNNIQTVNELIINTIDYINKYGRENNKPAWDSQTNGDLPY